MCGYPIALKVAEVVPLASPIPTADWANGRAVYRSDLVVRQDAPYQTLADTFSGTVGWTVEHSHSGFNALRHHLLAHRSDARPHLFRNAIGHLITARRILDSVLPHEITHTIFATHFGQPLPRWADEGACTTVDGRPTRFPPELLAGLESYAAG